MLLHKLAHPLRPLLRGKERSALFYDISAFVFSSQRTHYSLSKYYFLWTVIADRLRSCAGARILDLGCGTGQFASLLYDRGVRDYVGVDFSKYRTACARRRCPALEFRQADILASDALSELSYQVVIALEFFEHIDGDLEVLRRLRAGSRTIISVPNFQSPGHVRVFASEAEVRGRYGDELRDLRVDSFLADGGAKTYFLLDGYKT